jgi:hypothetical protein
VVVGGDENSVLRCPDMQIRKAMFVHDRTCHTGSKNATMTGLLLTAIALLLLIAITAPPANAFSPSRPHDARAPARPLFFHPNQNPQAVALPRGRRTDKPLLLSTLENSPPRSEAASAAGNLKASAVARSNEKTTTKNPNTSSVSSITTTAASSLDYNANVGFLDQILSSHWGVRAVLMVVPAIYGTNFALGSSLNEALANPALTTALRMVRDHPLQP